jgi:hypothetical protein
MSLIRIYDGRPRKKQKFANAEAAKKFREDEAAWAQIKSKWEPKTKMKADKSWSYSLSVPPGRSTSRDIPSVGDGVGNATAKPVTMYTGTEMIGIGQLHKSNAVPVFREQDAKDLASMRR